MLCLWPGLPFLKTVLQLLQVLAGRQHSPWWFWELPYWWKNLKSKAGPLSLLAVHFFSFSFCLLPVACRILVTPPRIEPTPPAVEVQILNHWTTRKVPDFILDAQMLKRHHWKGFSNWHFQILELILWKNINFQRQYQHSLVHNTKTLIKHGKCLNHIGVYFEFRELKPECTFTFVFLSFTGSVKVASLVAQKVKSLSAMRETGVQSLGWEDPLKKEMATHSSIFAWKIPWMEEPGGLQSTVSQRVGHNWATNTQGVLYHLTLCLGFPGGSVVRNLPANAGDTG